MGIQTKFFGRAIGIKDVATVNVSFDASEAATHVLYFPFPVRITRIRSVVTKALAGTDAGTITGANATGVSANGVLTHALSAPQGDQQVTVPTTNNTVVADSYYQVTSAKTTVGGKSFVTIEFVRT